jgi:osmotically-inducible protein OsmY
MKTDYQIQQDVIDQLKWEPLLNSAQIGVAVKNGIVTLSGIVETYYKKTRAENAAKKVSGVRAVAEELQVGVSPLYKKTDTEIAEAVLNTLKLHTSVPDDKIKVKVEDGIVTLEGEVDWDYQRRTAKESLTGLLGVRDIISYITLKPTVSADNIKQRISAAFVRQASIDASRIFIQVSGSKVTLSGHARSFAEEEDAINAAWSAPGISEVIDKIVVSAPEYSYEEGCMTVF